MIMIDDRNDNALELRRETRRMDRVFSLQFFGAYTLPLAVSVRPRAQKTAKQKNKHAEQSHVRIANATKNANEKGNEDLR